MGLIVLTVASWTIFTMPEVVPDKKNPPVYFAILYVVSSFFFIVEYVLLIISAPCNITYKCRTFNFITSPTGVLDFLSILPAILAILKAATVIEADLDDSIGMVFLMFRVLRLVELERFMGAPGLMSDVWLQVKDSLQAQLFMAIPVWIIVSALWYKFEENNPVTKHAFFTMPSSMFYASIFLGGNWPQMDFSSEGRFVAFFVCIAGIVLFAMPVGKIFPKVAAAATFPLAGGCMTQFVPTGMAK